MEATFRAKGQKRWYDPAYSGGLSSAELDDFLGSSEAQWLLKLAVIKEDGWPYVVPLWYRWDAGSFWLVGRKKSEWVHDLAREPRCAICVEERDLPPAGGNRKVIAQCLADVVEGPVTAEGSKWLEVANEMAVRYAGLAGAEGLKASYGWPRYLVKLTPKKLTSWQGVDWHPRYFDPGERPDLERSG